MKIGYARVSTRDQNHELQIEALKEYGCEEIYTETASGAMRNRPELTAILKFIREGDELVVWKFDRLARSLKQLLETVEALEKKKVGFVSIKENIDTSTHTGKLFFHIFGALGEFEREAIRERVLAGLDTARRMGRIGGRPKQVNKDTLKQANILLKNPDFTGKEVAKMVGIHLSTLYRYIPKAKSVEESRK
jgi:DNA invertase Pin-like site-specific DNA recombinase